MITKLNRDEPNTYQTIKDFFIFQQLPEGVLKEISGQVNFVTLEKGSILFRSGEAYHKGIYIISEGVIELTNNNGKRIDILKPGNMAGLSSFLGKSTYMVVATAEDNARLVFVPEKVIYKAISESEHFRNSFYKKVNERLQVIQNTTENTTNLSVTHKPVGNYMTYPIIKADKNISIKEASEIMSKHKIGALVLTDGDEVFGVLTAKKLVHEFLPFVTNETAYTVASEFADKEYITATQEFPMAEVLSEMQSRNEEYAIITKNKKPVGIISNKDILKILYNSVNVYTAHIDLATSLDELRKIYVNLYKIASELIETSRMSSEILPTVSSIHLSIQKKVHKITEEMFFKKTGITVSDINHCLIIMGSGARKEMMLDPDQDNGYIFDDKLSPSEKNILIEFGRYFVENLNFVGYKKCPGNIMVTNQDMSKTLTEWKKSIAEIINNPGQNRGFLMSSIVFDMASFLGNDEFVWELKDYIFNLIEERPVFLIQMLENDTNFKSPLSLFNNFIVEKDGEHKKNLNLKSYGISMVVDVVRAYTLTKKLSDLNTNKRLNHLQRKHILSEETYFIISQSYETVVDIVLRSQIDKASKNEAVDKYIDPFKLSVFDQNRLKSSLNQISKFLNNSLKYFKGHP